MFWKEFLKEKRKKKKSLRECFVNEILLRFASVYAKMTPRQHLLRTVCTCWLAAHCFVYGQHPYSCSFLKVP